ncbi:LOW QUALITY PROTEIN: sepiapterin reductase b [Clupea harengus]|uniref:LOW QUALITY PROTEIN: sepiapterin reductase b n=1 Tax=Clupea harengus TaxID=7950 RepID=A0A8M1KJ25_CLUHA|nr:LOW QUALITY PROTEIN: sepiapterin reductase b [Clupea harengus]
MESRRTISELFDGASRDLGRVLCIITGASRGYGRTLALQVSALVQPGSALVLVARSEERLRELQAEIQDSGAGAGAAGVAGLAVCCVGADLSKQEGLAHTVRMAKEAGRLDVDHLLLINNAVTPQPCLLAFPRRQGLWRTVVNLSSLCAHTHTHTHTHTQAFPSWVLYCTGKAARNMMFRVLRAEEEPDVKVLNYSPGPLDTDMQTQARCSSGDLELRDSLCSMFLQGQLLSCGESSAKLMRLLLEDDYPSGAQVDYYEL